MLLAESELASIVGEVLKFLNVVFLGIMGYLYTRLEKEKTENADLRSKSASNEKIRDEAVEAATEMAGYVLKKEGKPPMIPVIAPVVTQSNSPSTEKQRHEARIATAVAKLAAAKLAVGIEPRPEPERAVEKNK